MNPHRVSSKKVIMIMLDTLMDKPFQKALQEENLPAFSFFMETANYYPDIVAPYPTMSVNVESTLLTGHYSNHHHVPALAWYSVAENRIINYGTHIMELMKLGLTRSMYDVLYHLNNSHLNERVKTIHEELHEQGQSSASINPLVHRGKTSQTITIPSLIRFFVAFEKKITTNAASTFVYGRLAQLSPLRKYGRIWSKYGFNNNFSVQEFSHLIENETLPSFSIVYLPDHDKNVHKHGPMDIQGIKDMDKQLETILNTFPSWEEALESAVWILIGDNGQSHVNEDSKTALVDLRKLLSPLKITKLRNGVRKEDQVVLAPNLRSCFIYTLSPSEVPLSLLVEKLQKDTRIEMIAWKKGEWIEVTAGGNNKNCQFKYEGPWVDEYNQTWEIEGDYSLLDLHLHENAVSFGRFPDALARLYSALHSHNGEFIAASVKPGYEFISESTPSHAGGASHGGFHSNDSLIPMMVAGTDTAPEFRRIVDLKKWILQLIQPQVPRS
ncbi:alkaline phosphatase family protein [Bacillus sp. FJAT-44742]|uniref:alkaline phosphatase family protein n=1 Tax=Bacillus sp. FJAT-44742 TaxID=2014005 RepID=UPI000C24019E|nr:alkaline phosphatase family protein [Bacillus sp. FJAT-44742]